MSRLIRVGDSDLIPAARIGGADPVAFAVHGDRAGPPRASQPICIHASFAGHSFAGWILTHMATRYPSRIDKLIYLDAAFDVRASDSIVARRPAKRPALVDVQTKDDVIRWLRRDFFGMWSPALEAEYRNRSVDEDARGVLLAPIVADAMRAPEEWSKITSPVLAICALALVSSEFPWLSPSDAGYASARRYVATERRPFQHAECERFGRTAPHSRTLELEGHHYIFEAKQNEVVRAIREFLMTK